MYGFLSMGVIYYYSCVKFKIKKKIEEKIINNQENEMGEEEKEEENIYIKK